MNIKNIEEIENNNYETSARYFSGKNQKNNTDNSSTKDFFKLPIKIEYGKYLIQHMSHDRYFNAAKAFTALGFKLVGGYMILASQLSAEELMASSWAELKANRVYTCAIYHKKHRLNTVCVSDRNGTKIPGFTLITEVELQR
jgi:hypothetical protein